jgi:hypothetical protein
VAFELRVRKSAQILRQLAGPQNPQGFLLRPLAEELLSAVLYELRPTHESDSVRHVLYCELALHLDDQRRLLERDTQRMRDAISHLRNEGEKKKSVVALAAANWQSCLLRASFHVWRMNVDTILMQRRALSTRLGTMRNKSNAEEARRMFFTWRYLARRTRRSALETQLKQLQVKLRWSRNRVEELTSELNADARSYEARLAEREASKCVSLTLKARVLHLLEQMSDLLMLRLTAVTQPFISLLRSMTETIRDELLHIRNGPVFVEPLLLLRAIRARSGKNAPGLIWSRSASSRDSEPRRDLLSSSELLLGWLNFHTGKGDPWKSAERHTGSLEERRRNLFEGGSSSMLPVESSLGRDAEPVENFSSDLCHSEALLWLLWRIGPDFLKPGLRRASVDIDLDSRARQLTDLIREWRPDLAHLANAQRLVAATHPDMTAVLLAQLFLHHFEVPSCADREVVMMGIDSRLAQCDELQTLLDELEKPLLSGSRDENLAREIEQRLQATKSRVGDGRTGKPDRSASAAEQSLFRTTDATLPRVSAPKKSEDPRHQAIGGGDSSRKSVDDILRAASRVASLFDNVQRQAQYVAANRRLWCTWEGQLRAFCSAALLHRLRGEPLVMLDLRMDRERQLYTSVSEASIADMVRGASDGTSAREEAALLSELLSAAFGDLRKIFKNYAQGDSDSSAATLNVAEFGLFVRDCKVWCKIFPSSQLEPIFKQALAAVGAARSDAGGEMGPAAFVNALIRTAHGRFPESARLSQRVRLLLQYHVLNYAKRLDTDQFRVELRRQEFVELFRRYKRKLRKLFVFFATMESVNADGAEYANTIDFKEFLQMIRLAHLLKPEGPMTLEEIKLIFSNIQQKRQAVEETADQDHVSTSPASAPAPAPPPPPPPPPPPATLPPTAQRPSTPGTLSAASPMASASLQPPRGSGGQIDPPAPPPGQLSASASRDELDERQSTASVQPASSPGSATRVNSASRAAVASGVMAALANGEGMELTYPEYLEGLAVIASFRYSDPYQPLAERVELFLTRDFIPRLMPLVQARAARQGQTGAQGPEDDQ